MPRTCVATGKRKLKELAEKIKARQAEGFTLSEPERLILEIAEELIEK